VSLDPYNALITSVEPDLEELAAGVAEVVDVRRAVAEHPQDGALILVLRQGAARLGPAAPGDLGDHFLGGRVDDGVRLAAVGIAPFAVDEKASLGRGRGGHI